jgi:hypothetical protein
MDVQGGSEGRSGGHDRRIRAIATPERVAKAFVVDRSP